MLDNEAKQSIISSYRMKENDTGSTEVQVAMLTERVKQLTAHLSVHRKDYDAQRNLLKLVGHRRKLLSYMSRENVGRYNTLISRLGLRK